MTSIRVQRVGIRVRAALCVILAWKLTAGAAQADDAGGSPITQTLGAEFEGLFSRDIQLTQSGLGYGISRDRLSLDVSTSYSTGDFHYRPAEFDFLGSSSAISTRNTSGSIAGKLRLNSAFTLLTSGSIHEGYSEYRSAWLNEYYRQQFSSFGGPGDRYETPHPRGEVGGAGLQWEYLPTTGFIRADVRYGHEQIAPGYEIDFDGLRKGRPNLYTASYGVVLENVLTRRVRLLNEFRLAETTLRDSRYSYQGTVNVAVSEHGVLRLFGGITTEAPSFDARFVGGVYDWEIATGWTLSASGRFYSDTGEIENSLFSSAAPALTSWEVGAGLRRNWGPHSLRIHVAPHFTEYAEAGIGTAFFKHLYQSRTWIRLQLAYSVEF